MFNTLRSGAHSLRAQILTIVVVVWLVPAVALGGYIATAFFPTLREKTEAALVTGAEYAFSVTRDNVDRLIELAKDVTYDGELTEAYAAHQAGTLRYQEFYKVSRNYLERRFSRNPAISFAAFFPIDRPEQFMFMSDGYDRAMLFQSLIQPDALQLGRTLDTKCQFIYRNGMFCLVRNLFNYRLERFGMLVLGVREEEIFRPILQSAAETGANAAIRLGEYSDGGNPDWSETGLRRAGDELGFAIAHATKDYDLKLLLSQPTATLYAEMSRFTRILVAVFALLIPVCLLAGLFVHRRVVKPIAILARASARMEAGELGVSVPMRGDDEIGRLGRGFNEMSSRIRDLVERVYKEEIALRDAKIQAMQSRVNPHFLFNALETISWQARLDGNGSVSEMVDALGVLLNAAMDRSDRRLVPLREELGIAEAYFRFVRLRFGEKLEVEEDVDPGLLGRTIPPLFVQTLLENAVEHGIAPAGGGRIRLSIREDGGEVRISVTNSGKRLSDDELSRIRSKLDDAESSPGLGLRNIQQRLKLIYGEDASLTIDRDANGDTVASIRLRAGQRMFTSAQSNTRNDMPSQ